MLSPNQAIGLLAFLCVVFVLAWAAERRRNRRRDAKPDWCEMVAQFHHKFGVPLDGVTLRDWPRLSLRLAWIQEEIDEFEEGYQAVDLNAVADAVVDILYTTIGTGLELGLPLRELFEEVHHANMRKELLGDGHNKIRKPEGWSPPNIKRVLVEADLGCGRFPGGCERDEYDGCPSDDPDECPLSQ